MYQIKKRMNWPIQLVIIFCFIAFSQYSCTRKSKVNRFELTIFAQELSEDPTSEFPKEFYELLLPYNSESSDSFIFIPFKENKVLVRRIDTTGSKQLEFDFETSLGKNVSNKLTRMNRIIENDFPKFKIGKEFTIKSSKFKLELLNNFESNIIAYCNNCEDDTLIVGSRKIKIFHNINKLKNHIAEDLQLNYNKNGILKPYAVLFNLSNTKQSKIEICGNKIDDNKNGQVDENCSEICGNKIDDNNNGKIDENCLEICCNNIDDDRDGLVDENCIEICGNKKDDNCDGKIDENCKQELKIPCLIISWKQYWINWNSLGDEFSYKYLIYSTKTPSKQYNTLTTTSSNSIDTRHLNLPTQSRLTIKIGAYKNNKLERESTFSFHINSENNYVYDGFCETMRAANSQPCQN